MQQLSANSFHLLISAVVLAIISVALFTFNKTKLSVLVLVAASFLVALCFAYIDPFLWEWDEQFHALVSKNLMKHMLKPTLFENPAVDYNYAYWAENHIWLHKQPLFLWQMAISQYIFGSNELGVRFPDVLMHAVLTFIIFDMGRLLKNQNVGYAAAFLFTFMYWPLNFVSGSAELEHNDMGFLFYTALSFWAFFKYQNNQKLRWALLVGLFVGCAVLIKWLTAFVIYFGWFWALVYQYKNSKNIFKNLKPFLLSVLVAFVVFMPWQIYCYITYPKQFLAAMNYNKIHMFEPLGGHDGNWFYHFDAMHKLFGEGDLVPCIVVLAFIISLFDKNIRLNNRIVIALSVITVYAFFTYTATKMPSFTILVFPLLIITLANFIVGIFNFVKINWLYKTLYACSMVSIAYLLFDINAVFKKHSIVYNGQTNDNVMQSIRVTQFAKKLKQQIKNQNKVALFNCGGSNHIKIMFYNNLTAYGGMPTQAQYNQAKSRGFKIAVINNTTLPPYLQNDSSVIKINTPPF